MAEQRFDLSKIVCRFYAGSGCRAGMNCPFPHDVSGSREPDTVCRFFIEGRCLFAESCKYDHILVPELNHSRRAAIADASSTIVRSYADAVKHGSVDSRPLCAFYESFGQCLLQPPCNFVHGDRCDICGRHSLHPGNPPFSKAHVEMCEKQMEEDMEHSFAIQRSMDKTCGICMDVVLEKETSNDQRFGLLESCYHVFCLQCIRTWRKTRLPLGLPLEAGLNRTCPQCRIVSNLVIPSSIWIDDEDEKARLILEYKDAMSKKPCKFFKQGDGACPFGGSCYYLHATPDGTKVELPIRQPKYDNDEQMVNPFIPVYDFYDTSDPSSLDLWTNLFNSSNYV